MVLSKLLYEWDVERNGLPDGYADYSRSKVWWICEIDKSHRWQAIINNRANGSGCPFCSGRVVTDKNALSSKLVSELHPSKNGKIDLSKIARFSHHKLWWKCCNGHEWKALVSARSSGQDCPFCKKRLASEEYNLQVVFPEVARQWSPNNSSSPEKFLPSSRARVYWICDKGHEWQAVIADRTLSGSGCHICSGYDKQVRCEESKDGLSKRCNACHDMKKKTEFRKRRNRGTWTDSICKICESKNVEIYRTMTPAGFVAEIVRRKKYECSKLGLPFDLTKEFVIGRLNEIEWKCELTGLPMRSIKTSLDEKYQGFHLDSISIDRIKHDGGYTKDNIRFVLNQVNIFRSNGSDDRMYSIAEALIRNRGIK